MHKCVCVCVWGEVALCALSARVCVVWGGEWGKGARRPLRSV